MASVVSNVASSQDSVPIPPETPTSADNANNSSIEDPTSSAPTSSKQTVVTAKRKEELLLQARAERKRWVRSVPLPYDALLVTDEKAKQDAANRLWSREGLNNYQNSLSKFNSGLLSGATSVLSELYGIGNALDDDEDEEKEGFDENDNINRERNLPNRPLSVNDVAARVDKITKSFLSDEDIEIDAMPDSIDTKDSGGVDSAQENSKLDVWEERYSGVRAAYEEFTDAMLFPESAVTVQGMKNFVQQFASSSAWKKDEEDDDKLVQNMASAVNGQIRSSYESLATNNGSSGVNTSDAQRQGEPDWDRRSLESFLYAKVKPVVDTTLDRILANSKDPSSPNNPFLMTQSAFTTRLEELQFLQPSHLELKILNDDDDLDNLLHGPIKALQSIECFYSPYEKLCRVLDVYHSVNTALKNASKSLPMADDIISGMILVIVRASSTQMKSGARNYTKSSLKNLLRDLHFVDNFALQEYKRLGQGEMEYAFTSLYGAVYFLQGVELDFDEEESNNGNKNSRNRLFISNEELRRGLDKSRALAAKHVGRNNITNGDGGDNVKGLISNGANMLLGVGAPIENEDFGNESLSIAPIARQLSAREVRAARLRGESLNLQWALSQQEGLLDPMLDSTPAKTKPSSSIKSPSRSVFTPQRHTFLGARPESIKLSDLPMLLEEYRKLVLANEQLVGEHQRASNKLQMEKKRLRDEKHRKTLGENALLL